MTLAADRQPTDGGRRVRIGRLFHWKTWYYEAILPSLILGGPRVTSEVLSGLGRVQAALSPNWRRTVRTRIQELSATLRVDWDVDKTVDSLASVMPRFAARDYLVEHARGEAFDQMFEVVGSEHLAQATAESERGVVILGSHLGSYLTGLHWLYRSGHPIRSLVQRPCHVSSRLNREFDKIGPHPQSSLFLQRDLSPSESVLRMLRARAALQSGVSVFLMGDIPWNSPNARLGRFLGYDRPFLSVWIDLAILARVPVLFSFCTILPEGRYRLTFDPPWQPSAGEEAIAQARYLGRLEGVVRADPANAAAHLLWPCYQSPREPDPLSCSPRPIVSRPSRRAAWTLQPNRPAA